MYGDIEDLSAHDNIDTINLLAHNREQEKNKMMSFLPNPKPHTNRRPPHAQGGAVPGSRKSTSEREASETVVAVDDVPSGDGSTTRSYARYMMPMSSSKGGGRYMLYLVDTIGVKFSDEFNPPRQEIDAEFALVRSRSPYTRLTYTRLTYARLTYTRLTYSRLNPGPKP